MTQGFDRELDTSGLNCPLPILKTKRELARMRSGERLLVIATDPGAAPDFQAFAEQTGHRLLASVAESGVYRFLLEKR